jgi:hypothetical protein
LPESDFITQCVFQTLPKVYAERSAAAGGNMMGIERHEHDGLSLLAVVMTKTQEQEAIAYPKVRAWIQHVEEYGASVDGGILPWKYLNYSDKSQDPLRGYGEANVQKMRDVAAKYDPDQVFQKLCPGGFKISKVESAR